MAASFESLRRDRRYEIDSLGIAEFGPDGDLRRFISWENVNRIDFRHAPQRQFVHWSVRATDGRRITPKLGYKSSLECYTAAVGRWRELMPHAVRAHFARVYQRFRWALALIQLLWIVPALFVCAVIWRFHSRRLEIPWEDIGVLTTFIALVYVWCIFNVLLFLKELRLGFNRWYALMEANLTEPRSAMPPNSSFAILRWLFPAFPASAEPPITDVERDVYNRWWIGSILATLLLAALLTYEWYLGLRWAASLFNHEVPGTRFLVQPSSY